MVTTGAPWPCAAHWHVSCTRLGREVGFRVAKVLIVDSKLKVITVSSSGRVLQAGCPLGASVALRKPIDVTELVAAVRWTVQEQASA
jgi:hypothetical protein